MGLNIDMMKLIKSFNILVVKDELGCISSTIANVYAFQKYKTNLDLIILNTSKKNNMDNLTEIRKYTNLPVLIIKVLVYKRHIQENIYFTKALQQMN